jgi:excisionase family DNA binding protein
VAVFTDQDKRRRAAKRRQRAEKLRLERSIAISGAAGAPPAAISVAEFKKLTGVSHATVSRWIHDHTIQSVKVGGRRLIAFSEVERIKGE